MKYTATLLLLLLAPAAAQEPETIYITPQIPTEQQKVDALKLAYRLNGNSMVSYGYMIDLTDPNVVKGDKLVAPLPGDVTLTPPDADPEGGIWPKPQKQAALDVCARHKMHKSIRGKSWRCVR
jgi:hypothetical protein